MINYQTLSIRSYFGNLRNLKSQIFFLSGGNTPFIRRFYRLKGYRKVQRIISQGKSASVGKQGGEGVDMTHPVREQSPGETMQAISGRAVESGPYG